MIAKSAEIRLIHEEIKQLVRGIQKQKGPELRFGYSLFSAQRQPAGKRQHCQESVDTTIHAKKSV
jgi:hypothetical protein